MRTFLLCTWLAAMAATGLSCKKDYDGPITMDRLWNCHQRTIPDSATLAKSLVGQWVWDYTKCPEKGDKNVDEPNYYGVTLAFHHNQQVDLISFRGAKVQRAAWHLQQQADGLYKLTFTPQFTEMPQGLTGRILMCEPNLVFDESYRDACTSFFIRQ